MTEEFVGWLDDDWNVVLDHAQPIVRCRDCDHACEIDGGMYNCHGKLTTSWDDYNDMPMENPVEPDGFCKWASKRDE